MARLVSWNLGHQACTGPGRVGWLHALTDGSGLAVAVTPPSQRVQFILGEDADNGAHEVHPLFSEMGELFQDGDEAEWRETARWIKFEEDVEEGGDRWSKPHVATLSLHSLFELRSLLLHGALILDMEACSLETVADMVLDNLVNSESLPESARDKVGSKRSLTKIVTIFLYISLSKINYF